MPRTTKKAAEAAETKVEETVVVNEAAPAEKKAPAKKAAAKKPAAKKPAAKKPAAKKTVVAQENVYVQFMGNEYTSADLIAKAKKASGVKAPKKVDVYVKPEDNMVYYVVDNNAGSFSLS
ncbi:MAG: hypothetical protein IJM44_02710 [Ruminococcus sp.]|nr:hypothetical protein [Ruminococcus sp.]